MEEKQLFAIWIDEEGYYSTENKGITVEIEEMPTNITNVEQLKAYKYDQETQKLKLDTDKLSKINAAVEEALLVPSESERLADLELAFLELSTMMLGGE